MALSKVRRVVLLGTGTGVGKSFVIRALADALVRRCPSSKVLALKPVETGRASDSSFEDARSLEAVSRPAPQKPHPLYGLTDPVSPHLAAQRDGVHIEIPSIIQWISSQERSALPYTTLQYDLGRRQGTPALGAQRVHEQPSRALSGAMRAGERLPASGDAQAVPGAAQHRKQSALDERRAPQSESEDHASSGALSVSDETSLWSLIETAGGVFSPLTTTQSNFDLACALDPAFWLLVAPDALGVLHDVTATLIAMRERARGPDAVVLSAARGVDASTGTNAAELARLGVVEVTAELPVDGRESIEPLIDLLCG